MFPNPLSLGMNELYRMHQAQVSFEATEIHDFPNGDIPNSTFVPFPSLWRQAMLWLNSFSGEEPVRAIRPTTQTGSGTFCFRAETDSSGRPHSFNRANPATLPRSTVIDAFGRVNTVCEPAAIVVPTGGWSGSG
jgi:hypothetical protein